MEAALIEMQDVTFGYREGGALLSGMTLSLPAGSFHFLTGPSGSGKTSFLRLCYADLLPSSGQMSAFGHDVGSPRGDLIEAQHAAVDAGWIELAHVGGDLDMATIVNIMYLAADGSLTGIDGGNGRIELTPKGERFTGKLVTEAREAPMNETDMRCDLVFDLAVGWPG